MSLVSVAISTYQAHIKPIRQLKPICLSGAKENLGIFMFHLTHSIIVNAQQNDHLISTQTTHLSWLLAKLLPALRSFVLVEFGSVWLGLV